MRSDEAILASNTSSIPIMKIAMATGRPEHVIGIQFCNPVPVLQLIELVPSIISSQVAHERSRGFAAEPLGKTVIQFHDRAGFIVNYLLVPYLLSARHMVESGLASLEDIDLGMVLGCAHPMEPLHLADLIGLDRIKAVAEAMYEEVKESHHAPAPVLLRLVDAGLLGRKNAHGSFFYERKRVTVVQLDGRKMLRIEQRNAAVPIERRPEWIKTSAKAEPELTDLKNLVKHEGLHTECHEAGCLREEADEIGFTGVMSGPLVRSSYRAGRLLQQALHRRSHCAAGAIDVRAPARQSSAGGGHVSRC